MDLTKDQALAIYNGPLKASGHPDPLGYIGRAQILTNLNPEYIDTEGRVGMMPVTPQRASEILNANVNPSGLIGNVFTTIAMELIYYTGYKNLNQMMIAFHDGTENINEPSQETRDLVTNIEAIRQQAFNFLFPPLATFEDFAKLYPLDEEVSQQEFEVMSRILRG